MTTKCIVIIGVSIVVVALIVIMGKLADSKDEESEKK